jgi:uncharacterized UPF0160 family protein
MPMRIPRIRRMTASENRADAFPPAAELLVRAARPTTPTLSCLRFLRARAKAPVGEEDVVLDLGTHFDAEKQAHQHESHRDAEGERR